MQYVPLQRVIMYVYFWIKHKLAGKSQQLNL
jgi:hypothetical protein